MANFRIVWEIELDSSNPLAAAVQAQRWMRANDWQFYVQNSETKELFSVDLSEEPEDAVIPVPLKEYIPIIEK
jgi:hypothetical protein